MKNPLYITNSPRVPMGTKLDAVINVLNIITTEMFDGRVKQAQADILANKKETENAVLEIKADLVDMVELEYLNLIEEEI